MSVPGRLSLQGLWIAAASGVSAVNETTPEFPGQLGKVTSLKGGTSKEAKVYQYVRRYTTDTATATAGSVAFWQDLDDFVVSAEGTDAIGAAASPIVAGVFLGANPTTENYGFIQVSGIAEAVVTGTAVAGAPLVVDNAQWLSASSTNDDGDLRCNAIAIDAFTTATGTAQTVLLDVVRNGW